ncbi:hypothetical protein L210DRAFT_877653, partial [Boletus edulis BED1]
SSYPFAIMWGPGCIGRTQPFCASLYGVEISQFVFYLQAFPCDSVTVKLQVYIVTVLDTVHSSTLISGFYHLWITCRANTSPACSYHHETITHYIKYCITFMVQVFYAQRVWISKFMVPTPLFFHSLLLRLFNCVCRELVHYSEYQLTVLFSTKYTPMSSIASAVCDAIITLSVMYYLRPRSIRRQNLVKRLLVVFVEMGMFTFINALSMVVLYYIQIPMLGQFLTVAPGVILSKTYVNSMLAVLNARKPIRDEERNALSRSIELPTIVTLR